MISKKLVHDIAAFHNTWSKDNHVIAAVEIFRGKFIGVRFAYWTLRPDGDINYQAFCIIKDIKNREDYYNYTIEVNRRVTKYLSKKQ